MTLITIVVVSISDIAYSSNWYSMKRDEQFMVYMIMSAVARTICGEGIGRVCLLTGDIRNGSWSFLNYYENNCSHEIESIYRGQLVLVSPVSIGISSKCFNYFILAASNRCHLHGVSDATKWN